MTTSMVVFIYTSGIVLNPSSNECQNLANEDILSIEATTISYHTNLVIVYTELKNISTCLNNRQIVMNSPTQECPNLGTLLLPWHILPVNKTCCAAIQTSDVFLPVCYNHM